MADSSASSILCCIECGTPLPERDRERLTCHDCRSSTGKLAELDLAIRVSDDHPDRIPEWPRIRHLLRQRFGQERSESELWERSTDWLRAEFELGPNDYLRMPLPRFVELLNCGKWPGVAAGEAFWRAIQSDPVAESEWVRTRHQLHILAGEMQEALDTPEYRAAEEAERQRWQDLANAIREALFWAGDELSTRHFARPTTIEDWDHLARIVKIPAATTRAGNRTVRGIFACARAWADRQTIKAKLAAETKDEAANGESASQPVLEEPTKSWGGWMGDVELAAALGVHSSQIRAFRAKLKRMRDKGELSIDDWQEFENRKRNQPQFHYRLNAPAIVAMAKRYSLPK